MTNDEINRENLEILIYEAALPYEGRGGVQRLADKLDASRSQVSQWRNASVDFNSGKRRSMSAETCRRLEDACNKERGWMDVRHPELAILATSVKKAPSSGAGRKKASLLRGADPRFIDAANKVIDILTEHGIFAEALGSREVLARKLERDSRHKDRGQSTQPINDKELQNIRDQAGAVPIFKPARLGRKKSPSMKQGDG